MDIQCYSQRLLNPFRGVINTIRYQSAEAVTMDGVHWDIYVRNADLVKDLENPHHVQTSDIRYGKWNEKTGLKRGPLHPSNEFKRLENLGAIVFDHLLKAHKQLPFPLQDQYEYWLLDNKNKPLALLDSAVDKQDIIEDTVIRWRAGLACRNNFHASHMEEITKAKSTESAQYLEDYINSLAGTPPQAHWFYRQPDGSGRIVSEKQHDKHCPFEYSQLSALHFPPLLIKYSNHDQLHLELLKEFFAWQAPWLLLMELDESTRQAYELLARKRAREVYRNYRLYPEIINQQQINAACVEAMLTDKQTADQPNENIMSTFYIELQSTTME